MGEAARIAGDTVESWWISIPADATESGNSTATAGAEASESAGPGRIAGAAVPTCAAIAAVATTAIAAVPAVSAGCPLITVTTVATSATKAASTQSTFTAAAAVTSRFQRTAEGTVPSATSLTSQTIATGSSVAAVSSLRRFRGTVHSVSSCTARATHCITAVSTGITVGRPGGPTRPGSTVGSEDVVTSHPERTGALVTAGGAGIPWKRQLVGVPSLSATAAVNRSRNTVPSCAAATADNRNPLPWIERHHGAKQPQIAPAASVASRSAFSTTAPGELSSEQNEWSLQHDIAAPAP